MKLNKRILVQMIREEVEKLETAEDRVDDVVQDDVEPGDLADTLAKPIDMLKVLKIEESKIRKAFKENKRKQAKILAMK